MLSASAAGRRSELSHPPRSVPAVGLGWNPWRSLREQPDLEFALGPLSDRFGGAVYSPVPAEGWAAIVIDNRLSRTERADALAHELVHHERGGTCPTHNMPDGWAVVARREERRVQRIVAERRVPLDMLAELVNALEFMELPVEAWSVAQQFDVTEAVATTALQLLQAKETA